MLASRWRAHAIALLLYVVVVVAFSWPLPLHLSTHLTGPVDGDTGVYVWNQWVFQHELLENRSLPYFTGTIFSVASRANLSLHNYTTFANLIALPLVKPLGIIATFNVVYLLMTVLSAYAMFLLARHLIHAGAQPQAATRGSAEAWLAGMLFAWSPVLVTRGAGHFSLVAAAPLPVFMLLLLRAQSTLRVRDGVALGLCVAWAASTDVYYAVFCLLLAAMFLGARLLDVHRYDAPPRAWDTPVRLTIDVLIVCVGGLVLALAIGSGWQFTFLGRVVSIRSFYTPVLLLTLLLVIRVGWRYRATMTAVDGARFWRAARLTAAAAVASAVVLSPVLYAVGVHIASGRFAVPDTYWRTSPAGIDLLAAFVPNPNHPLAPETLRQWLTPRPDAYLENVASLPFVALGVIGLAWRAGWHAPRLWLCIAIGFGLLALGPFVQAAGVNTYVPTPWAVLRYVPLVGLARAPARFSVIVVLAVAALFALALAVLAVRRPRMRPFVLAAVAILMTAELLPVPRTLYSAEVPHIFRRVADDPRGDVRVLELPFGIRDGASSVGNFSARTQFHQTFHHKPLIGGYLSRVSKQRIKEMRASRVLVALMKLSEGREPRRSSLPALMEQGPHFVRRAKIGYVVIDRTRASAALIDFAIRAMRLQRVDGAGSLELYIPAVDAGLASGKLEETDKVHSRNTCLGVLCTWHSPVQALPPSSTKRPGPVS